MNRQQYMWLAMVLSAIGIIFYVNFRPDAVFLSWLSFLIHFQVTGFSHAVPVSILGWLPSSIFTAALISFSLSCKNTPFSRPIYHVIFWVAFSLLIEILQLFQSLSLLAGTFSWSDIIATCCTGLIMSFIAFDKGKTKVKRELFKGSVFQTLILIGGIMSASGSSRTEIDVILGLDNQIECQQPDGTVYKCDATPIYVSKQTIRSHDEIYFSNDNATQETAHIVSLGANIREYDGIKHPGKIYVYNDLLLVNYKHNGVYLFDNTNPSDPKYIAFIKILGAQDMVVKNDVLFVDSFTDIVRINLQTALTATSLDQLNNSMSRSVDILPPPNYDKLSGNYDLETVVHEKGIVIGFKDKKKNRFFFWDLEI